MERSIFRASLLGSNGGDQEKKRKISLSTSQFTGGENKPENSELEKGNSPKRKLEVTDNEEDDRPLKKQKLISEENIDNLQDQRGPEDDFESFFETNLPTSNDDVNTNQVPREDKSEENSNNNNTNESGDKDVDEEGLESLEEMHLSPALFGDSDVDEQDNQSENNQGLNDMKLVEIKDDEVSVTAHKNSAGVIDLKKAHPNDDDDFDMKRESISNTEDNRVDLSTEQETEGEKELIGDLILSPEGEEPVVKVVAAINRKLRPYQREGVKFLYNLYRDNKGGILGDDMGLGKTVQTISFISAILAERKKPTFKFKLGGKTEPVNNGDEDKEKFHPVLVIAPSGVVMNWEREFQNWGKLMGRTFAVHRYMGPQRDLSTVQRGNSDVVLSSYDTFRRDFDLINTIDWACIVFDEVHKVKDRKAKITVVCKKLRTQRRYGLTGTVMQNNFEELWTLLDFVQEGCLETLDVFRKKYINAIKNGQRRDASPMELAKSKVAVQRLNRILKGVILRRDQSIIKDLLPGKDDNIVFCQLSELQLKIYKKLLQSQELQMLIKLKDKCACGSGKKGGECCLESSASGVPWKQLVFPAILTLQKIANHPGLLLAKSESKADAMPDFVRTAIAEFIPDIKNLLGESKHDDLCGKMRTLASLLNIWSTQNKKVLLFSYSTRMLDILEQFIKLNNYSYSRLDGAMGIVDRQREMDTFNKQNAQNKFIFLISTKAGGLGLNITSASIVVVFDASWNVTNDLQAQDRAYRIGQTKYTHVYRLVSAGTIEEMVYNRQIYKQQMASIGVEGRHERRYFTGVLGVKGSEGEIFGLANLLKLNTDKILTSEIIKEAKQEETQYRIEKRQATTTSDGIQDLMKQVLDENLPAEQPTEILDLDDLEGRIAQNSYDENLAKLMRENGVVYSHNNKQILGDSQFERKMAEDAQRVYEREARLKAVMEGRDLSKGSFSARELDLNPQPYTGLSPNTYRQLSPNVQAMMAPYVQKTTMAGLSSSTHPAVSSLHPEKGRPLQLNRFSPPTSSFLPKNFEKQQQLITISSEESDDSDDEVQIDSNLSTAPRLIRDFDAFLAQQRELLSHPSETSRIPLPQQQLHNNLSGARPFMPTVPLPGGMHQAVQAVQHRGIPPAVLGPAPNLGLDMSPPSHNLTPDAMARLKKYVPLPTQAPNANGQQPAASPLSLNAQLQGGAVPMAHPLINSTAAANNGGNVAPGLPANSNTSSMNQFRALFPQHNFDNLLPKQPPSIDVLLNNNNNAQAAAPATPQPVSSAEKQNLAAQVIDID